MGVKKLEEELGLLFTWKEWIPMYGIYKAVANERHVDCPGIFFSVGSKEDFDLAKFAVTSVVQVANVTYHLASFITAYNNIVEYIP